MNGLNLSLFPVFPPALLAPSLKSVYEDLYKWEKRSEKTGDLAGQLIPSLAGVDVYKVIAHPEERTPENIGWAAFDVATLIVPVGKVAKVGGKMFESLAAKLGIKAGEEILFPVGKTVEEIARTGAKIPAELITQAEKQAVKLVDSNAMKRFLKIGIPVGGAAYLIGRAGTGEEKTEDEGPHIPVVSDFVKFARDTNKVINVVAVVGITLILLIVVYKLIKEV